MSTEKSSEQTGKTPLKYIPKKNNFGRLRRLRCDMLCYVAIKTQ